MSYNHEKWHFEHADHPYPYCLRLPSVFEGNTSKGCKVYLSTQNPVFVNCIACLEKMKENGITGLTKEQISLMADLKEKGSVKVPESDKNYPLYMELAHTGHIAVYPDFNDDTPRFFMEETGILTLEAQRKVFGE